MRLTREEWVARIAQWKDSGLTAAAYAAEIGVRPRTLEWWTWRLASAERQSPLARRSVRTIEKAKAQISPLTFVEMTSPVVRESLEVVLPKALRVRVPVGFDDATLGRLLDVLERRR